jgi:hypothetical protein
VEVGLPTPSGELAREASVRWIDGGLVGVKLGANSSPFYRGFGSRHRGQDLLTSLSLIRLKSHLEEIESKMGQFP